MSHLSEIEKLYVRFKVIQLHMRNEKIFAEVQLKEAIEQANGAVYSEIPKFSFKLKSAKALQRNCLSRVHKQCPWIPAHFKAKILRNEKGLTKNSLRALKQGFIQCKSRYSKGDLGDRIPNSHANIWNVTHHESLDIVVAECKKILLDVMLETSRVRNNAEKCDAIRFFLREMKPFEIDYIEYRKGKSAGAEWHEDSYCLFGTVVVVLQDSLIGRLHVQGLDIPEYLNPGDVVVVDSACLHQVTTARRDHNRVTATIVF